MNGDFNVVIVLAFMLVTDIILILMNRRTMNLQLKS